MVWWRWCSDDVVGERDVWVFDDADSPFPVLATGDLSSAVLPVCRYEVDSRDRPARNLVYAVNLQFTLWTWVLGPLPLFITIPFICCLYYMLIKDVSLSSEDLFFGHHEGKLETFAKICVVASLETPREDPTVYAFATNRLLGNYLAKSLEPPLSTTAWVAI